MRQRSLGRTGISVSEITLGTVELGMDYGFRGSSLYSKPDRSAALALIRQAVARGVTCLDTARAYGEAEALIGESGVPAVVATKVSVPDTADGIEASIRESLRLLRRDRIDILKLHNPTPEILKDPQLQLTLRKAVDAGRVGLVGASVYGEATALAVLEQPLYSVLQVPFNLLDQKMAERVFPLAEAKGVGVFVRSVFLRGVLTARIHDIPARLAPLRERVLQGLAGGPVEALAGLALRFCLSFPAVSSAILGIRDPAELEANLAAAAAGPLDTALVEHWRTLAMSDDPIVSPLNWQDLI